MGFCSGNFIAPGIFLPEKQTNTQKAHMHTTNRLSSSAAVILIREQLVCEDEAATNTGAFFKERTLLLSMTVNVFIP